MRHPGPRPTNAEMAQLVELLEQRGLIEVYTDDEAREAYRLTEMASGRPHARDGGP